MSESSILLIEDDEKTATEIVTLFRELGLGVEHRANGTDGLACALKGKYDLVILDVMLPGKNGFDICRELRASHPLLPVILLTTRNSEIDRVLGFELGADDYVTKPFSGNELLARVRRKLRRADAERSLTKSEPERDEPVILSAGELEIDLDRCTVHKNGSLVKLTAMEFQLLAFFMRNPGRVFSKYDLLESVWDVEARGYENAVVSMVRRLRTKIEDDITNPIYILNSRGMGYAFAENEELQERLRSKPA